MLCRNSAAASRAVVLPTAIPPSKYNTVAHLVGPAGKSVLILDIYEYLNPVPSPLLLTTDRCSSVPSFFVFPLMNFSKLPFSLSKAVLLFVPVSLVIIRRFQDVGTSTLLPL
nr:unknown protein [synthetic construct]